MKERTTVAAALVLLSTLKLSESAQPPPKVLLPCPQTIATITVDGRGFEWAHVPALCLGTFRHADKPQLWGGLLDCSATVRAQWNRRSLFLFVQVEDDTVINDEPKRPQDNDGVELRVKSSELKAQAMGLRLVPFSDSRRNKAFKLDGDTPLRGVVTGVTAGKQSYAIECAIPWQVLGMRTPTLGDDVGFSVSVVDVDGSLEETVRLNFPDGKEEARLELGGEFRSESFARYASALMAVGVNRRLLLGDVEVYALMGRSTWGIGALELKVQSPTGDAQELGKGTVEVLPHLRRWHWRWRVPDTAEGNFTMHVTASDSSGNALGAVTSSFHVKARRYSRLMQQMEKAVKEMQTELEVARKNNDRPKMGRLATALLHATRMRDRARSLRQNPTHEGLRQVKADARQILRMQELIAQGKNPLEGITGVIERAYLSEIDDTFQPYSLYVPPFYFDLLAGENLPPPKVDAEMKPHLDYGTFRKEGFPLVVILHGLGGSHALGAPSLSDPLHYVLIVAPFGRGPTDYKAWGEADIIRVIEEVKRDYHVDQNRVYMTGTSMGGTGSWQVATHYPDLFAAIAPVCGNADHRVWEKEWGWGRPPLPKGKWQVVNSEQRSMDEVIRFIENVESSVFFAENLLHVPSFCVHGSADYVVPVGHSRSMTSRLKELGYQVIYDEQFGVGHGGFFAGTYEKLTRWLLKQRRPPHPKRVVFKTAWLRYKGAYWVEINRFERYLDFALIDAEVTNPNVIEVRAQNVSQFTLNLTSPLVKESEPVAVRIEGKTIYRGKTGSLTFAKIAQPDGTKRWMLLGPQQKKLIKSSDSEGPIENAFLSRFIIVYGTQGNSEETQVNQFEAQRLADHWARWASGRAIVKRDVDVTDDDVREANLILIGSPQSNKWVSAVNEKLPIRFDGNKVVMNNGKWFEGEDIGVKFIYPNPLNQQRYVVICAGANWKGTYDVTVRFGNFFDWGLFDNRGWFDFCVFDARTTDAPETALAIGFFDQDWKLSEALTWYGDEALRRRTPPKRVPESLNPSHSGRGEANEVETVYLSDLKPVAVRTTKGEVGMNRTVAGLPLTLGGFEYEKGLSVHPDAEVTYELGGRFKTFSCRVGIDLEGREDVPQAREDAETVAFQFFGDDRLLAEVRGVKWFTPPQWVYLNIEGIKRLRLAARMQGGARWLYGNVDFADAAVSRESGSQGVRLSDSQTFRISDSQTLRLSDGWTLSWRDIGRGVQEGLHRKLAQPNSQSFDKLRTQPANQLTAKVNLPATVQALLGCSVGVTPTLHPEGFPSASQVEQKEWWFQKSFTVPKEWKGRHVQLILGGVSYQADVWLNGKAVGTVRGLLRRGIFDVSAYLNDAAENLLSIRVCAKPAAWTFEPNPLRPVSAGEALAPPLFVEEAKQMPVGLWQPVMLKSTGACRIESLQVSTIKCDANQAQIVITVAVKNLSDKAVELRLQGKILSAERKPVQSLPAQSVRLEGGEEKSVRWHVEIQNPKLWWTHDLGQPALYRCKVEAVLDGKGISDAIEQSFGIRTIEFVRGPARLANVNLLKLNGERLIWLKGTEWLPPDLLLRASPQLYKQLICRAIEGGFNTLLVSAPEAEEFYDLCDRLGVFVIQEFPFAKINPDLIGRDEILASVKDVVLRLRHRPCVLFWSAGRDDITGLQVRKTIIALDPDRPAAGKLSPAYSYSFPVGNVVPFPGKEGASQSEGVVLTTSPLPPTPPQEDKAMLDELLNSLNALVRTEASGIIVGRLYDSGRGGEGVLLDREGNPVPAFFVLKRLLRASLLILPRSIEPFEFGILRPVTVIASLKPPNPPLTLKASFLFSDGSSARTEVLLPSLSPGELHTVGLKSPSGEPVAVSVWVEDLKGQRLDTAIHLPPSPEPISQPANKQTSKPIRVLWLSPHGAPIMHLVMHHRLKPYGIELEVAVAEEGKWRLPPGVSWQDLNLRYSAIVVDSYLLTEQSPEIESIAEQLLAQVGQGVGLLYSGVPLPQRKLNRLGALLPVIVVGYEEGTHNYEVQEIEGDHPAISGLEASKLFFHPSHLVATLKGDAAVLLACSCGAPLIVEGGEGKAKVMVIASEIYPLQTHARFLAALLAYLSGVPHHVLKRIKEGDGETASDLLPALSQIDVHVEPLPKEVSLKSGSAQLKLALHNRSALPIQWVALSAESIPSWVKVWFDDNYFPLLPDERREVSVWVTQTGQSDQSGELKLTLKAPGMEAKSMPVLLVPAKPSR